MVIDDRQSENLTGGSVHYATWEELTWDYASRDKLTHWLNSHMSLVANQMVIGTGSSSTTDDEEQADIEDPPINLWGLKRDHGYELVYNRRWRLTQGM